MGPSIRVNTIWFRFDVIRFICGYTHAEGRTFFTIKNSCIVSIRPRSGPTHREIFSKSYQIRPKLDCIYHAPIEMEPNEHPFAVPNHSNRSDRVLYVPQSVCISKRYTPISFCIRGLGKVVTLPTSRVTNLDGAWLDGYIYIYIYILGYVNIYLYVFRYVYMYYVYILYIFRETHHHIGIPPLIFIYRYIIYIHIQIYIYIRGGILIWRSVSRDIYDIYIYIYIYTSYLCLGTQGPLCQHATTQQRFRQRS